MQGMTSVPFGEELALGRTPGPTPYLQHVDVEAELRQMEARDGFK